MGKRTFGLRTFGARTFACATLAGVTVPVVVPSGLVATASASAAIGDVEAVQSVAPALETVGVAMNESEQAVAVPVFSPCVAMATGQRASAEASEQEAAT